MPGVFSGGSMKNNLKPVLLIYTIFVLSLLSGDIISPIPAQEFLSFRKSRHPILKQGWKADGKGLYSGDEQSYQWRKIIKEWMVHSFPDDSTFSHERWSEKQVILGKTKYNYIFYEGWAMLSGITPSDILPLTDNLEQCGGRILQGIYDPKKSLLILSWGAAWMQDGTKNSIETGKIYFKLGKNMSEQTMRTIMNHLAVVKPLPVYNTRPQHKKKKPVVPVESEKMQAPEIVKPVKPQIAIVIDDFGANLNIGKKFIDLDIPITVAILPKLAYSIILAEYAQKKEKEIILHLPMEARDPKHNPGPGAILTAMDEEDIRREIRRNLGEVPYTVGVNNHMGSKATTNSRVMRIVMDELKRENKFFIDSLTIKSSLGYKLAKEYKIPALKRDIFIDNEKNEDYILRQLEELVSIARENGYAVGIGHVHIQTFRALEKFLAGTVRDEIEFVFISSLVQ